MIMKYALAVESADYLGIPKRDFADSFNKKLQAIARKIQMSWDEVGHFYTHYYDSGLSEIAAISIFNAWWNGKLDEEERSDDMETLADLRGMFKDFDEDLKQCFINKKADVENRWAEKKKAREEAENTAPNAGGFGESNGSNGCGAENGFSSGTGWENKDDGTVNASTGVWDKPVASTGDWDKPQSNSLWDVPNVNGSSDDFGNGDGHGGESSGDWADEMIGQAHPVPISGGW